MVLVQAFELTSSVRFDKDEYLFEYGGVRYKLLQQDPKKHANCLLTILPSDDNKIRARAYAMAGEFASALAWHLRPHPIALAPGGGMRRPDNVALEKVHCVSRGLPAFFTMGNTLGFSISRIAAIETHEQRRALALFREAGAANSPLLRFLFYWQAMDIPSPAWTPAPPPPKVKGKKTPKITRSRGWADAEEKAGRTPHLDLYDKKLLACELKGRTLGEYLEEDGRHAIAHFEREPGRRPLIFDDYDDLKRMGLGWRLAEALAKRYIEKVLGLSKGMSLMRKNPDGFPVYVKDGTHPVGYVRVD